MNAEELNAIKARLETITPGEWRAFNYSAFEDDSIVPPDNAWWLDGPLFVGYDIYQLFSQTDADFIAHAPADVRALLDQHDADTARIEALEAALRDIRELSDQSIVIKAIDRALNGSVKFED